MKKLNCNGTKSHGMWKFPAHEGESLFVSRAVNILASLTKENQAETPCYHGNTGQRPAGNRVSGVTDRPQPTGGRTLTTGRPREASPQHWGSSVDSWGFHTSDSALSKGKLKIQYILVSLFHFIEGQHERV